jgi:hypothetical protein
VRHSRAHPSKSILSESKACVGDVGEKTCNPMVRGRIEIWRGNERIPVRDEVKTRAGTSLQAVS